MKAGLLPTLFKLLKEFKNLRSLILSKNMLDISSVKRLCSEIRECPLEFLDLSKN